MPSEVDKQELDLLLWIILSDNNNQEAKQTSSAIMGLL
jgi:hypothetical protein